MDEPDEIFQMQTEEEQASPLDMLPRYDDDEYDWMSDPEDRLLQVSNDHQFRDDLYSPEYETEPGLSPDSNLHGASVPTPMSMAQYVMPATPSANPFEPSNGMSSYENPNSVI
ncbi:hypothetical protein ACQKWADRAFT_248944 [Trichoderma austrokoningii]